MYDAASDTWLTAEPGPLSTPSGALPAPGALSSTGDLMAVRLDPGGAQIMNPSLGARRNFPAVDIAMAFDSASQTFYGVIDATDELVAYSTATWKETGSDRGGADDLAVGLAHSERGR